jgi:ribose/xylose/arabinose/galactoside ABC-type transport system permease subunit
MTDQPIVIEYRTPPPRRTLRQLIGPRHFAWAAGIVAALSLAAPLDIGSGRVIVNPLRVLGCIGAVACVMFYAILGLWRDRSEGAIRAWVFGVCLIVCTAAFSYAHLSGWGGPYTPRLSLQHEYWRAWLVFAGAVIFAIVVGVVSHVLRRRSGATLESDVRISR